MAFTEFIAPNGGVTEDGRLLNPGRFYIAKLNPITNEPTDDIWWEATGYIRVSWNWEEEEDERL